MLVAGMLVLACRNVTNLAKLGRALNEEFETSEIRVGLTDGIILALEVTDSALAMSSCETQIGFAARVSRLVPEHYPDVDSLQVVSVSFHLPSGVLVPLSHARLPIRFSPAVIRSGIPSGDSVRVVASCRSFEELNSGS